MAAHPHAIRRPARIGPDAHQILRLQSVIAQQPPLILACRHCTPARIEAIPCEAMLARRHRFSMKQRAQQVPLRIVDPSGDVAGFGEGDWNVSGVGCGGEYEDEVREFHRLRGFDDRGMVRKVQSWGIHFSAILSGTSRKAMSEVFIASVAIGLVKAVFSIPRWPCPIGRVRGGFRSGRR